MSSSSSKTQLRNLVISNKSGAYPHTFLELYEVRLLLKYFLHLGTFSLHSLKRGIHAYMRAHPSNPAEAVLEMRKPDGLLVREMFDPELFQPGAFALMKETYPLRVEQMSKYHVQSCQDCCTLGSVSPSCYFTTMLKCITHGWHPPCRYKAIVPKYYTNGNYPSVSLYDSSARKEFTDMVNNNVLIPTRPENVAILNPLGIVIKNSDKMRARVLANVVVTDQESLSLASERLIAAGHAKIKCRVTTDLSATGVNDASYRPPFRYPSLGDALRVVTRNCYIASGDVSRYFHSFPLALECRPYWCVEYGGKLWSYARACFGHGACPYYASTWSAEFRQWALSLSLDPAFMVDDWFLCAPSLSDARRSMEKLCAMYEDCGFAMAVEKFQYGQQIVFIGVLIDTVSMTMRFDATQARGARMQMETYLNSIKSRVDLDHSTIRHVCGKLNWYAEVVQSGRMHIKSWWDYEKHGRDTCEATRNNLISDTQWWVCLLANWEHDSSGHVEYKIMSASEIQNNPRALMVIQSDASGDDGFGYYYGYVGDKDMSFTSKRWNEAVEVSSHTFELSPLEYFLRNECTARDAILVWITDNQGAAWSVNKGSCRTTASRRVLGNILEICDSKRLQLLAMWVPRERNELADYLSHLATTLNRDCFQGRRSEL